jgi:SAM-dependent methyltransferase
MTVNSKTIQSYSDNASDWAKNVREGKNLLQFYIEKPAMLANLPDLKDKTVLCLGCGSGEECQTLLDYGATKVMGVDPAQGLIEVAQKNYPGAEFKIADTEAIPFPDEIFDFAYSSLVMHYLTSWQKTLEEVFRVLRPGSHFLLSIIHPVNTAMDVQRKEGVYSIANLGFDKDKISGEYHVTGDYLNQHPISLLFLKNLEVTYIHRPFGEIMADILNSRFDLVKILEPKPIPVTEKENEMHFTIHSRVPMILIIDLLKK